MLRTRSPAGGTTWTVGRSPPSSAERAGSEGPEGVHRVPFPAGERPDHRSVPVTTAAHPDEERDQGISAVLCEGRAPQVHADREIVGLNHHLHESYDHE